MKRFIKKLALFTAGLLLILLVAQVLIDLRDQHKFITGADSLDTSIGNSNDLVFLGSSRCAAHFAPALFEKGLHLKAINLGVDGHSELPMHILRLANYLAKNHTPRIAVLSFDPLVSAGSTDDNGNMVNKNQFARYAFLATRANKPIVDYFRFDAIERYVPLYALLRYKLFPDCITLPNDRRWKNVGYDKHDEEWDTLHFPNDEFVTRYYFDTAAAAREKLQANLMSLDSLCRQNNIRLICVQTPVYKSIYKSNYFELTGQMCSRLNIPFFDISKGPIKDSMSNFYNSDHMNTNGVSKMTAQLLSDTIFINLFKTTHKDLARLSPAY